MRKQLSYLWALVCANMKSYAPDKKRVIVMSLFMMMQNTMFFALWIILFGAVKDLNGWQFQDVTRMFGFAASSIGLSLFCFNGSRSIAYRIQDNTLDTFIAKPKAVLPALLTSSSSPASLGDVLYGPFLWICFGNVSLMEFLVLSFLTINATLLFTALSVIVFSFSFWLKGNARFGDQLFEMLIILSANITHGQPFVVRLITFTVLPAAFINYLPVEIVKSFNPYYLFGVIAATVFYGWVAIWVFNAGLRRYIEAHGA